MASIEIRRAAAQDAPAIAAVHIASWRTTYAGLLPQRIIEQRTDPTVRLALWERRLAQPNGFIFVAAIGTEICGFAAAAPMPDSLPYERDPLPGYDAYLEGLYSLVAVQGHGIGRQLLRHVAKALTADGLQSLCFHVVANNPTRGFYEHLGAAHIRDERVRDGDDEWLQCAYGWQSIAPLLAERA
jgi:ribosomal protein S18 acetylase RimI-like enzyme